MTSDKETETFRWLGAAPPLREWRGHRLMQVPGRYTTSITHVKYEASMRFDVDDLRRTVKSGNQIPIVISEMAVRNSSAETTSARSRASERAVRRSVSRWSSSAWPRMRSRCNRST